MSTFINVAITHEKRCDVHLYKGGFVKKSTVKQDHAAFSALSFLLNYFSLQHGSNSRPTSRMAEHSTTKLQ